jgi:hypothetical protein
MYGYRHECATANLGGDADSLDTGSRAGLSALCTAGRELPEAIREGFFLQLSDLLSKRLQLQADRQLNPEIAKERIEEPIVICGLPRSGTSLLHALLALDPENRAPRSFELMTPSPANPDATERTRRIAVATGAIEEFLRAMPQLLKLHP